MLDFGVHIRIPRLLSVRYNHETAARQAIAQKNADTVNSLIIKTRGVLKIRNRYESITEGQPEECFQSNCQLRSDSKSVGIEEVPKWSPLKAVAVIERGDIKLLKVSEISACSSDDLYQILVNSYENSQFTRRKPRLERLQALEASSAAAARRLHTVSRRNVSSRRRFREVPEALPGGGRSKGTFVTTVGTPSSAS